MKKVLSAVLVLGILLNVFCIPSFAANENTYNFVRLDDGSGNKFYGIANVGNTVIVTSANGKYILSKDAGDTWVDKTTNILLRQICSDGKRFVSLDSNGKVYVSLDGETWNTSVKVWNSTVTIFDFDGKYFYLGYSDGKLFRSIDGTTWHNICTTLPSDAFDLAVNYDKNIYAFILNKNNVVKYTSDFKTYKNFTVSNFKDSYCDILYYNGTWYFSMLFGKAATSKDLVSTQKLVDNFQEYSHSNKGNYNSNLVKMINKNSKVYVMGFFGKIRDITNMSSITKVTNEITLTDRLGAHFTNLVSIGDSFISYSSCGEIFKYKDNSWKLVFGKQSMSYNINSIPEKKAVLALSDNNLILLEAGKITKDEKINLSSNGWSFYDNTLKVKGPSWYTATTTDFVKWNLSSNVSNDFACYDFAESKKTSMICISASKDVYAFKNGYYSLLKLPLAPINVENINDDIYVVGNGGVGVKISDNMKTTSFNVNKETCIKIIKGKDTFVVLHKNAISTSKDLKTWTTSKISDSYSLNDITYDDKNKNYIIACSNGTLLTSKDLKSWFITDLNITVPAYGVAAYNGYVYVVADGGVLLASDKLATTSKKAVVSTLKLDNKETTVFVENNKLQLNQKPFVEKGITMVPAKDIVIALGGTLELKGNKATIVLNDKTIVINANSDKATVNGKSVTIGAKAKVVGGSIFVPVQFISNNLNCDLYVEGFSNTIYISAK